MLGKEFVTEIIEDTLRKLAAEKRLKIDIIPGAIYEALVKELEIYILTKDYVGKLT